MYIPTNIPQGVPERGETPKNIGEIMTSEEATLLDSPNATGVGK